MLIKLLNIDKIQIMYLLYNFIKKKMVNQLHLFQKWINGLNNLEVFLELGLLIVINILLYVKNKELLNILLLRLFHLYQSQCSTSRNNWPQKIFKKLLLNICIRIQFKSQILMSILLLTKIQVFLKFFSSLINLKEHQWSIKA